MAIAIQRVVDDSLIWKNKGIVSQEIQELFQSIETLDVGATYEVQLSKSYKSLRTIVSRNFAGRKLVNMKPKDQTWTAWYIRVDPKSPKARAKKRPSKRAHVPAVDNVNSSKDGPTAPAG